MSAFWIVFLGSQRQYLGGGGYCWMCRVWDPPSSFPLEGPTLCMDPSMVLWGISSCSPARWVVPVEGLTLQRVEQGRGCQWGLPAEPRAPAKYFAPRFLFRAAYALPHPPLKRLSYSAPLLFVGLSPPPLSAWNPQAWQWFYLCDCSGDNSHINHHKKIIPCLQTTSSSKSTLLCIYPFANKTHPHSAFSFFFNPFLSHSSSSSRMSTLGPGCQS